MPLFEIRMLGGNTLVRISARNETGDIDGNMSDFYVYKALLQNASPYFQALKNFKEGEEDVVEFKGVDPKAVSMFVYWLHTRKLPEEPQYQTIPALVAAYTFGDRILAPKFKNFITDHVRTHAHPDNEWGSPPELCYSPKTLMALQNAGLRLSDGITRYLINYIAYSIVIHGKTASNSELSEDDDQEFFRNGGDWVWSLMQRVMCAADKFRQSLRATDWDGYPRGDAALHPSLDRSGKYHEPVVAPDEDDDGEWGGPSLNW